MNEKTYKNIYYIDELPSICCETVKASGLVGKGVD
ncbi:hypothetical protein CLV81_2302 [Flagellimonas meridianipacifica]|uniref:Uncharacterized protein n=1 Tax=Flagellimonas meridianipacifica TaxID=1080225 RepID=A0A2T0M8V3_9FLAO|nr:hypothetical protein CLV81_2302 [Allomuricauda pacifica]